MSSFLGSTSSASSFSPTSSRPVSAARAQMLRERVGSQAAVVLGFNNSPESRNTSRTENSSHRAELYDPARDPVRDNRPAWLVAASYDEPLSSRPATSASSGNTTTKPPAEVSFEGTTTPLYTYAQLEQVSSSRLRQRARALRDSFGEGRKSELPHSIPGERRGVIAWILDAQLSLGRLSGLDPERTWAVTRDFGAPDDLLPTVIEASDGQYAYFRDKEQSDGLIPVGTKWFERGGSLSSTPASSRCSTPASTASRPGSSIPPSSAGLPVVRSSVPIM